MIPLRYNLRSLLVRKTMTLLTAVGVAFGVWVLASALMLSRGVVKTLASSGRPDTAIVLRKGSDAELGSAIEDSLAALILAAPGIKREGSTPVAAGEVIVVGAMEKLGTEGVTNVQYRGVTEGVFRLRPEAHVTEGRVPQPGADEVLVGARIRGRFKGVDLGESFEIKKGLPVKVVGVFEASGSSYESEVWIDRELLRGAFRREGYFSSVRARLESAASFDGFQNAVESDKRLGLKAMRETEYYEKQSENTSVFVAVLGKVIAFFFSLGAMIGASITMYAAVANRTREIGTLRALGFSRTSVLLAFLMESVALALLGGLAGTALSLAMGWFQFSMMNFTSWSEIVFKFEPTADIVFTSLTSALGVGLVGGFFPAVRASRVSPIAAMRA